MRRMYNKQIRGWYEKAFYNFNFNLLLVFVFLYISDVGINKYTEL